MASASSRWPPCPPAPGSGPGSPTSRRTPRALARSMPRRVPRMRTPLPPAPGQVAGLSRTGTTVPMGSPCHQREHIPRVTGSSTGDRGCRSRWRRSPGCSQHDRLVAQVCRRRGLYAGVVELDTLARCGWARSQDQHLLPLGGHALVLQLVAGVEVGSGGGELRAQVSPSCRRGQPHSFRRATHLALHPGPSGGQVAVGKAHACPGAGSPAPGFGGQGRSRAPPCELPRNHGSCGCARPAPPPARPASGLPAVGRRSGEFGRPAPGFSSVEAPRALNQGRECSKERSP